MEYATSEILLEFAIAREQEAHDFYVDLAGRVAVPAMQVVFKEFAREELKHKARLEAIRAGRKSAGTLHQVTNLMLGDYLDDVEVQPEMDYQAALILAMKREKAAFRLYTDMAAGAEGELKETLLLLAQEEAKHKLRLEMEYDEVVLKEN